MGLLRAIVKNVGVAAAVIVGQRVWAKITGKDARKTSTGPAKAPVKAAAKLSTKAGSATSRPKAAAKPKAPAKPRAAAKPKTEVAAEAPTVKPEPPAA